MISSSPPPLRLWQQPSVVLGVLVLAGYFLVARGVGNLFPFSTFSMYSGLHTSTGSRLVARDARGELHELDAYDRWRCEPGIDAILRSRACPVGSDVYSIGYIDREAVEYLAAHTAVDSASGRETVEVLRRAWRFGGTHGAPQTADCPLLKCEAVRR